MFPDDARAEIERLAAAEDPPPRTVVLMRCPDGRPMVEIESRAFYEWRWRRGIADVRERTPHAMRAQVIARDGLVCHICGGVVRQDDVHVDHVLPVARGGRSHLGNLKVAHSRCNVRKGAR